MSGDADLELIDSHAGAVAAADLIVVFGTRHWTPAEIAASLFKRNLAPAILVTGGPSRDPESTAEAHRHRDLLTAAGVPGDVILVEDRSSNTVENVTMGWAVAERALEEVRTVIAVTKWYHRRAVVTLAHHVSAIERIYVADYTPFNTDRGIPLTRERWEESCPKSVRRETAYLRQIKADGIDLLRRSRDGGWIRS